ncbi:chromosomal replication initiator protein DnaA [Candidatus Gottesmanbacteria bacterium]|nr:chromosomal replication initiator protein DnaA [Candidatus Gottesmanbacteria bacterium]
MDQQILWQTVLSDLELQVSKAVFQTLLSKIELLSISENTATISCQQPMLLNLIENRYYTLIKKTLDSYTKNDNKLVFTSKTKVVNRLTDGPLFTMPLTQQNAKSLSEARLNADFTFKNFAVSSSNQMAYAAATAVAQAPGVSYNPLFLYGGVGVGKTHLMQAVGHELLKSNPAIKIIYCTGEEFTNEIIEAIGNKTTTPFKKKYRQADLLMIDDIQFIAGKYSVQEEFFHTFNAIHQIKKQIILTSDRPPEEINKLEERLRSRFEGGLTIDIGQPDFELRTAILLIKAKQRGVNLPMEAAQLLASNVDNIRKLEGVFIRVLTESQTRNIPLDEELVKNVLGKTVKNQLIDNKIAPQQAINAVASFYNLKLSQLKGARRDKYLSLPRQILYYLMRVELGIPLMNIGDLLGGRDHSTILHGVRKISNLLSTDEKIREDIMGIKNRLKG